MLKIILSNLIFLQSNVKPQATEIGTATHLVLQKKLI